MPVSVQRSRGSLSLSLSLSLVIAAVAAISIASLGVDGARPDHIESKQAVGLQTAAPGAEVLEFEDWVALYEATLASRQGHGITRDGEWRWVGDQLPTFPLVVVRNPSGVIEEGVDPVAYATLLTSDSWELRVPVDMLAGEGVGPRNCMAVLIKDPPPALGFNFTCNPGCPILPCTSSEEGQGFCACSVTPPTEPPGYCNGTFTPCEDDNLLCWQIECGGSCGGGECEFRCLSQGGQQQWYCGCQ